MRFFRFLFFFIFIALSTSAQNVDRVLNDIKNYSLIQLSNGFKVQCISSEAFGLCSYRLTADISGIGEGEYPGIIKMTADVTGSEVVAGERLVKTMISHTAALDSIFEFMASVVYGDNAVPFESFKQSRIEYLLEHQPKQLDIANKCAASLTGEEFTETAKNLEKITYDALLLMRKQCYSPDRCVLTVISPLSAEQIAEEAKKHFGSYSSCPARNQSVKSDREPFDAVYFNNDNSDDNVTLSFRKVFPYTKSGSSYALAKTVFEFFFGNQGTISKLVKTYQLPVSDYYPQRESGKQIEKFIFSAQFSSDDFNLFFNNFNTALFDMAGFESAKRTIVENFKRDILKPEYAAECAADLICFKLPKDYFSGFEKSVNSISSSSVQNFMSSSIREGKNVSWISAKTKNVFCLLCNAAKFRNVYFSTLNLTVTRTFKKGFGVDYIISDYLNKTGLNNPPKNLSINFNSIYTYPEAEFKASGVILRKYPKMYRMRNDIVHGQDTLVFHYLEKYDGRNGSDISLNIPFAPLDSTKNAALERKACYPIESFYSELKIRKEFVCDYDLDSAGFYKVKLIDSNNSVSYDYFSNQSALKMKTEILNADSITPTTIITYDSYAQKGQYTIPVHYTEKYPGFKIESGFKSFDFETVLKKSEFEVPVESKKKK